MRKAANSLETFESLIERYQGKLNSYALRIVRNREDAEEVVQDAFVRAYRAWARFDAKPPYHARVSAWLFRITANIARNRFRKKQLPQIAVDALSDARIRQTALEDRSSPDVIVDRSATIELVERAIRQLPICQLQTARLRFIEGLTLSEIAVRCSRPLGTIKSHVSRARQRLRQVLEPALGAAF
ncbi:MAG TPA: sigma-70 family RNA polymerase sigma factor [Candidatus Acidoferrum sp.]|nr:sigma-70 family RNA polymerase sigma factor [Candidatus Acidoferrum sp.]